MYHPHFMTTSAIARVADSTSCRIIDWIKLIANCVNAAGSSVREFTRAPPHCTYVLLLNARAALERA